MNREGNKSLLVLMEQVVMFLVFAFAAGICLQAFGIADRISMDARQLTEAVSLAQKGAELMKDSKGNLSKTADLLKNQNYELKENYNKLLLYKEDLDMLIEKKEAEYSMGTALVTIYNKGGEVLYQLEVMWQENSYEKSSIK